MAGADAADQLCRGVSPCGGMVTDPTLNERPSQGQGWQRTPAKGRREGILIHQACRTPPRIQRPTNVRTPTFDEALRRPQALLARRPAYVAGGRQDAGVGPQGDGAAEQRGGVFGQ